MCEIKSIYTNRYYNGDDPNKKFESYEYNEKVIIIKNFINDIINKVIIPEYIINNANSQYLYPKKLIGLGGGDEIIYLDDTESINTFIKTYTYSILHVKYKRETTGYISSYEFSDDVCKKEIYNFLNKCNMSCSEVFNIHFLDLCTIDCPDTKPARIIPFIK